MCGIDPDEVRQVESKTSAVCDFSCLNQPKICVDSSAAGMGRRLVDKKFARTVEAVIREEDFRTVKRGE